MAQIVSMLELQLPGTTFYEATQEGVEDASSNVYTGRLVDHPRLVRQLSDGFFGVEEDASFTAEIASLEQPVGTTGDIAGANPLRTAWRAVEPRGAVAILRRKNLDDNTISERMAGKIDKVDFAQNGATSVRVTGTFGEKLSTKYPRIVVNDTRFPTATDEKFANDLPIPIHFGAHREHTPGRYIEEDFTLDRYRYVLGLDLKRSSTVWSQIRPFPNTLYIGVERGVRVIPAGEYDACWNPQLSALDGTDLTAVASSGGSLPAATQNYAVAVITTAGTRIFGAGVKSVTTVLNDKVTVGWAAKPNAAGYEIYRWDIASSPFAYYIATQWGGGATEYIDTGALDEDFTRPLVDDDDSTGQHTAEVLFGVPQYGASSQLSSVLADMEYTELAPDDDADGLWLFRGDMRDECSHRLNWLHDEDAKLLFLFDRPQDGTAGTDRTGAHAPVHQGTPIFARGQRGKACWDAQGIAADRWLDTTPTGLDFDATTDFRIDVRCKPATDSGDLDMVLASYLETSPDNGGWSLAIEEGRVVAYIYDGTLSPTATGTSQLVGNAWHTVSLVVDRTADTLVVEVDGNVEASTDITGVITLAVGSADLAIGNLSGFTTNPYKGLMEWVSIKVGTAVGPFVNGKAGSGASALDLTVGKPQYVRDASATGLELATEDITLEAWVYRISTAAKMFIISKTDDSTLGYQLRTTGTTPKPTIGMTGQSGGSLEHSTTLAAGVWSHVAGGREGSTVWIALNGVKEVSGATTAADMSNAFDVTIGALNPAGSSPWLGYIDEARISVGTTRTADQLKEAYYLGMRNPARQVQHLLASTEHGPGLTCDATTCDAAALAVDGVVVSSVPAVLADYALVEQQELRLHLRELLKLRGLRLALNSSGNVTMTADTQQASSASFGFQAGQWNNMVRRPVWSSPLALSAMKQNLAVRYRRVRTNTGAVDRFLLRSSDRVVFTIGDGDEPLLLDAPAIRDQTHADLHAYYRQQRGILEDSKCQFDTGEDALALAPGTVVTLDDPASNISAETHEVRVLTEQGGKFGVETRKWASAIYGYSAGTLPTELAAESTADFSSTPPASVTGLSASFALTEATDGTTHWTATMTWTNPTVLNFKHVAVAYAKGAAGIVWKEVAAELNAQTLIVDGVYFEESTTYRFRVTSINEFGVRGLPAIFNVATTLPGAPSQVTGVTALTAGHRTRRWKWTRNARSENVDHYEYEVDSTDPISTALESGEVRNPRLTYTEVDLGKTTNRYARARAINANGTAGTWSSVVLNTGNDPVEGDAGVGDIDPASVDSNDIADVAVGNPHLALTGSKVLTGTHADVVSSTNTFNTDTGSRVLVILTGLVEFSDGATAAGDEAVFKLLRGATEEIAEETLAGGGMNVNASQTATYPFSFLFVDTVLRSGSVTWKMQARKIGTPGVTTLYNVRISVVELSR